MKGHQDRKQGNTSHDGNKSLVRSQPNRDAGWRLEASGPGVLTTCPSIPTEQPGLAAAGTWWDWRGGQGRLMGGRGGCKESGKRKAVPRLDSHAGLCLVASIQLPPSMVRHGSWNDSGWEKRPCWGRQADARFRGPRVSRRSMSSVLKLTKVNGCQYDKYIHETSVNLPKGRSANP